MRKKNCFVSAIIALVMCFCVMYSFCTIVVKADILPSAETVFNETNTYNLNGSINHITDKKEYGKMGYSEPQYSFKFDMSDKNGNTTTSIPYVTVFTHGYNSYASDWMNNAEYIDKASDFDLAYNEHSMVSKVVELYGLDNTVLLIADMENFDSFKLKRYVLERERERDSIIKNSEEDFNIREQKFGKQYVIVFDSFWNRYKASNDSNNNLYYQFNYMLSHVLYDIKQIDPAHRIPKVNLIGHSRGGLTNLQYALDHPDIVENLISIGTPYFGSTSVSIVQNVENYTGDGLRDIINPSVYEGYRNTWNNGYENMYSKINAVAIGAYSTLPFLAKVAHSDRSGTINFWGALGIDAAIAAVSAYKVATRFKFFFESLAMKAVTNLAYKIFPQSITASIVELLANEIVLLPPTVAWFSDAVVSLNSQLAIPSIGIPYKGFKRKDKCFSLFSSHNLKYIAQWDPPVVHNLEPWDEDIIGMVESELRKTKAEPSSFEYYVKADGGVCITGVENQNESALVIPSTITVGQSTKTVTEIAAGAFGSDMIGINSRNNNTSTYSASDGLESVRTIIIPAGVRKIGNGAFKGMSNLETVTFANSNQTIEFGTEVFAYCSSLQNITLPGSPTEIPAGMFKDCVSLSSMPSPSSLREIGATAFSGCSNMVFNTLHNDITEIGEMAFFGCKGSSLISLPSGITSIGDGAFANITDAVSFVLNNANQNYMTENGVLFNKSRTEVVQYPKGRSDVTFIANANNSSGSTNTVTSIRPYAFYGCENLTSVNITGVEKVGEYAFANANNIETITAQGLRDVSYEAFSGTQWFADEWNSESNNSQIVLSNCLLLYTDTEEKIVKLNDWNSAVYYIAEQAFASTALETIYIPSYVKGISDNAFYNATSLKNVYFESMNNNLVASLSSSDKKIFGNNSNDLKVFLLQNDLSQFSDSEENALAGIRKELYVSTFTLELYNGTNEVGQVTINYGDTYSFARSGYSIKGISYDYQNKSMMDICFYNGIQSNLIVSGVTVATFSGWKTEDGELFTEGTWKGIGLTAVTRLYADWTLTEFTATLIDELNNTNETETFTYFTSVNLPSPWKNDYQFRAWVDSEGNEYKLTYSGVGDVVLNAVYDQIYMLGLTSKFNYAYNERFYGIAGTVIILPSFSVGNYYVVSWSGYPVLLNYTITKTEVLVARWNEYVINKTDPELETMGNDGETEYGAYKNMSGDYSKVADIGIDFDTEIDVGSINCTPNSGSDDCCFVGSKEWVLIDPRSVMINQEQFKNMRL